MGHSHTIKYDGKLLKVKASGKDYTAEDVLAYGKAIIEASITYSCTAALLDEYDVEYALGTIDLYESAVFISEMAPKIGRVAVVCKPQNHHDADFWGTVAVNRGLTVRVFKSLNEAEAWLQQVTP